MPCRIRSRPTAVVIVLLIALPGHGGQTPQPPPASHAAPATPPSPAPSSSQARAAPSQPEPSPPAQSRQAPSQRARLRALREEAAALAGTQRSLIDELRRLDVERQIAATEVEGAAAVLATLDASLAATAARIGEAERDLAAVRPAVRDRLVRVYKLGRLGYTRLLLDLDDVRTFRRTARVVSLLAQRDRARLDGYARLLATLQTERTRLDTDRRRAEEAQRERQRGEQALAQAVAAQQARLSTIAERRELNARLLGELTAARDRLSGSVDQLAAARGANRPAAGAAEAAGAPRGGSSAMGTMTGRAGGAGRFAWPLTGRLHSSFGRQPSSRFGTMIARNGVEIAADEGSAVRAVDAGTVAFADPFGGFGQVVILDHGGKTYSLYGHLSASAVQRGEAVERGQVVGASGTTPMGVPAVYFELRIDGKPVDPVQWLKR